jgi:predicted DNA binding CopG/RHH family protein
MKYYELDQDEQKILKDFEEGKLRSVRNTKQGQKQYQHYAQTALDKTKNVNIRISEHDLLKIKAKAMEKGIPYQTMITSVIHQYSTGKLSE